MTSAYRADIDGLRAIAVLAVVGFHADIGFLRGGFAGVDVFFVISGYLITGFILKALENGTFSFTEFYVRRINRIFPALVIVLAATLVMGWPILYPGEFRAVGKHVLGGAGFASNFILWSEAGYFDSASKPLLHLWSLGIEEQFYLLWPVVVVIAFRRRWNVAAVAATIVIASFALNVRAIDMSLGTAAFYSPVTRFWEILAGAVLVALERKRKMPTMTQWNHAVSITGGVLVIACIVLVSNQTPWPGWPALLPVLGTLCIIAAGDAAVLNRYLLSRRWLVAIGLISYPLYLWHWPLMVYARLAYGDHLPRVGRAILIIASIILAFATYVYVEKPIRFSGNRQRKASRLIPALGMVATAGLLVATNAITSRLDSPYTASVESALNDRAPGGHFVRGGKDVAMHRTPGDTTHEILVTGDSHAAQYFPRFDELARRAGGAVASAVFLTYGGCPPIPGVNHSGISWDNAPYRCDFIHSRAMEYAKRPNVKAVVYSSWWETYFDHRALYLVDDASRTPVTVDGPDSEKLFSLLENEIRDLRLRGKLVYIVLSNPSAAAFDPLGMLPSRITGGLISAPATSVSVHQLERNREPVAEKLRALAARTGAVIVDPFARMCDSTKCPTLDARGAPIYRDEHHIRASYARADATFLDSIVRY
jgi:peptidoglycan/LPS O-acetylase OafA/YrhL